MRGTGKTSISENLAKESILSIQFSLNGLSFVISHDRKVLRTVRYGFRPHDIISGALQRIWAEEPSLTYEYQTVKIIVDTDKICWIPQELFDGTHIGEYLLTNAIPVSSRDDILTFSLGSDLTGILPLSSDANDFFFGYYGEKVVYTHPMELNFTYRPTTGDFIFVNMTEKFAHVLVQKDSVLQLIDSFSYATEADILFILYKAFETFDLKKSSIIIAGVKSAQWQKTLARYYKSIVLFGGLSQLKILSKEEQSYFLNALG